MARLLKCESGAPGTDSRGAPGGPSTEACGEVFEVVSVRVSGGGDDDVDSGLVKAVAVCVLSPHVRLKMKK